MAFDGILLTEIFYSIQGETTHAGLPYIFIRLTGCNLRCHYCDTTYSFKGGTRRTIDSILEEIKSFKCKNVLLTGGEPLLQRGTLPLLTRLHEEGYEVSIETHGELSIESVKDLARIVLDIKTPGSGMNRGFFVQNLKHLKKNDEIKFVITNETDYHWAKEITHQYQLHTLCTVLFSPVIHSAQSPQHMNDFSPKWLSENILKDRLPVRMQFQLHKLIWGVDQKGV